MAPSYLHEGLVALLREQVPLLLSLLRAAHQLPLATTALELLPDAAELTELDPAERRADLALLGHGPDGHPAFGLLVEVQLAPDPDKAYRWPAYATAFRDRRRCPVELAVVCVDEALARALAQPIYLGLGASVFQPLVLGPEAVPLVVDLERARREPELAVLSALAHRDSEAGIEASFVAVSAANGLDERRQGFYVDLVLGALSEAARMAVEARMTQNGYQYQTEFARTYFAKGLAEGEARGKAEGEAKGEERGKAEGLRVAVIDLCEVFGIALGARRRARIAAMAASEIEALRAALKQTKRWPKAQGR